MGEKLKLALILVCFCWLSEQQQLSAQNGANFVAGVVLAGNINLGSISDTSVHHKGFHAGVDARIGPYGFYLSPGLHYYQIDIQPDNRWQFFSSGPKYHLIKGPINIAYKMFITRQVKFRIKGGLDLNYVLLIDENDAGINFDTVNDAFFGVNLGAGFDISRFTIDFNYESGLTNYIKDQDDSKLNFFSASIGFFF